MTRTCLLLLAATLGLGSSASPPWGELDATLRAAQDGGAAACCSFVAGTTSSWSAPLDRRAARLGTLDPGAPVRHRVDHQAHHRRRRGEGRPGRKARSGDHVGEVFKEAPQDQRSITVLQLLTHGERKASAGHHNASLGRRRTASHILGGLRPHLHAAVRPDLPDGPCRGVVPGRRNPRRHRRRPLSAPRARDLARRGGRLREGGGAEAGTGRAGTLNLVRVAGFEPATLSSGG